MRIGRHMPTNSRRVQAAEIAHEIGCNAIQIFASNPTAWQSPNDDAEGCQTFAQAAARLNLDPVVLHAPYLINLASSNEANMSRSRTLLEWTLKRGALLGAKHVVVHMGSHKGEGLDEGVKRFGDSLAVVLSQTPPEVMLLLENSVGNGNLLGGRFEEIRQVLDTGIAYAKGLGVCLDTAHLWGAGFDISTPGGTLEMLNSFDEIIGLDRLQVLHLNDSAKALGSQKDVHARWGEGMIGTAGLRTLLNDPRMQHVSVLMETPIKQTDNKKEDWDQDKLQLDLVKSFVR